MKNKKNKRKANQKRRQKRAAAEKVRRKMTRQMMMQYAHMRRQQGGKVDLPNAAELEPESPIEDHYKLDDELEIAKCGGVGECCMERYVPVEPSDIWRILRNEKAREKWGVTHTPDLYGKGKPLIYDVDAKTGIPGCAIVRVEGPDGRTHCPFLDLSGEKPECILGDDRFTFCKADPITRTAKVDGKRRLSGWSYAHNGMPCNGCMQADPDEQCKIKVEDWLVEKGLEERYLLTDLFHGFIGWLRGTKEMSSEVHRRVANILLFNWHEFLIGGGVPRDQVPWEEPHQPAEIITSATNILQGMMDAEAVENAKDEAGEPEGEADQE